MIPFAGAGYETLADPTNPLSPYVRNSVNDLVPDGIGYRFFIVEGATPPVVGTDVCPAGYEATWYSFTSSSGTVAFGFSAEIRPLNDTPGEWFSPIFMDDYRAAAGNPVFASPVHLGFCAFSNTSGDFYRSHDVFAEDRRSFGAQVSCEILVNNSGNQYLLDSQTTSVSPVFCSGVR